MTRFECWFNKNLREYASDISSGGADAGWPFITYNSDGAKVYDKFKDDIWQELQSQADEIGFSDTMSFIGSFHRRDMVEDYLNTGELDDRAKTMLVWFMVESMAHRIAG